MKTKTCRICKKEKSLEDFHLSKQNKGGHHTLCKDCHYEYTKQSRKRDPEWWNKWSREYAKQQRQDNRDRVQFLKNIHRYIKRRKDPQEYCTICNQKKRLDLSNISGKYQKDPKDYLWLCRTCHILFDKIRNTHIEVMEY